MAIKHKFSSEIPDGLDPKLVKPSDWNEDHFVDFEGLAKSIGGVLLKAIAGTDYLRPDGSGSALTGITATQVGLGNVTNESKATMFTSPVLTGTPTGPTAPVDTNSTQLATTEFFAGQAAIASPLAPADIAAVGTAIKFAREDHVHPTNFTTLSSDLKMNGSAAVGLSTKFPRADHVHPTDTSRAPVASPTFTGVVTGPQFVSTVATGTAPFVVASNTLVSNLNAQYLGGTPLSGFEPAITTLPILKGGTGTTTATGSGSVVLSTSPVLVTPNIGVATGTSFNSITGLSSATPNMDGTAAVGTSTLTARQDHVHPTDTSRQATLVSGTNIKTIFNQSILGSGDLTFQTGIAATAVSTATAAVKDTRYVCDTSAGTFTLTLPATPAAGDYIEVVDSDGTFVTNNLIIGRNGSNINGAAEDFVLDVSNVFVTFTYSGDATRGWQVDIGGSDLVVTVPDDSITFTKLAFDGGRSPYAFFKLDSASVAFTKTGAQTISIKAGTYVMVGSTMVSWSVATAVVMPTHAIGTDYYIYACTDGTVRADANATSPTGYDTTNSRKIGGYHYGRIRNTLTVTDVAVEIVPRSLWDLTYRPKCNPDGMIDVYGNGHLWADIYQAAVDSAITLTSGVLTAGSAKSIYNGTPLTGTEGLHGYNFIELAKNSGKRLMSYQEWLAVAHGSPQGNDGDNLNAWSMTTNTGRSTTGQVARAVSFCGACDCVGNVWEWLDEFSNDHTTTAYAWQNVMTGQNVGQLYLPNATGLRQYLAGGAWSRGVFAGSRALVASIYAWYVTTNGGSRFACDGV
ncbi:MAG: hypothetical protein AB7I29_07030 [Geobacter sp.]